MGNERYVIKTERGKKREYALPPNTINTNFDKRNALISMMERHHDELLATNLNIERVRIEIEVKR